MDLTKKTCKPCEGGVPKLKGEEISHFNSYLRKPWEVVDEMKITNTYHFEDYSETMKFVNQVAKLAEEEGHHPVMHVFYSKVEIDLWTHAIMGLSENDFILAAKIEGLNAS
jgi:4a-hydroxytetrahydrobiopterin dehydratase